MARLRAAAERRPVGVVRLPGVGERLDVTDVDGAPVQVVRRQDGTVELHGAAIGAAAAHAPGAPSPIELDATTATSVAAFVTGRFVIDPAVAARMADVLGGLVFDWVRLERDDVAVGRTLAELALRERTSVTVVAVLRGSQPIVAPDPDLRLERGDDLIVAARQGDVEGLLDLLSAGT